ncbi:hypothetical protein BJ944DRAFT_288855 [Cunninghamella echinulata]|nr:hypothetical protein BJ944DRAFT_288855 [Cunninghamella echinulata]
MLLTRPLKLIASSSLLSQQLRYSSSSIKPLWQPLVNLPINEFAKTAFFSLDRPLLDLHNIKDHEWQFDWSPSEYQPYQPPPLPTTTAATNTQPTTSSTRTITFNISKIDGELHVIPDDIVGYDQVVDYLSAMQQKYTQMEQQKKKRKSLTKKKSLRKRFFEKN